MPLPLGYSSICLRRESNPQHTDFKSVASTSWATQAYYNGHSRVWTYDLSVMSRVLLTNWAMCPYIMEVRFELTHGLLQDGFKARCHTIRRLHINYYRHSSSLLLKALHNTVLLHTVYVFVLLHNLITLHIIIVR